MFKEAMADNYRRTRCLFIDQVYHDGHKFLHEAMFSNFSIIHKMIWTYKCYTRGVEDKAIKSLARASADNKKSLEYRNFCMMQLNEEYATETKIMNEVQKILLPDWKRNFILFEKTLNRWQKDDFFDSSFERKYVSRFNAIKKIDQEWPDLRERVDKLKYNWEFITKSFEEEMFKSKETIESPLWKLWKEKRFKMIKGSGYDEKCCWLTMCGFKDSNDIGGKMKILKKKFEGKKLT